MTIDKCLRSRLTFDFSAKVAHQGRIHNFLIGGSNLQMGVQLINLPNYLLIFTDISEKSP